ncbi:MAG: energy-coupling factor ABC transporter ATP-binding protein [Nitrososphaerales archaeon]
MANNAIEVKDLWWRYSQDTDWVLRGVNFEVRYGEAVCIVGPTGAGKTTLLSCIQSLLPHSFSFGEMKGQITVDGADTRTTRAPQLAGRVGMVFEDAEAQFIFPTVQDDLYFGLENLNISKEEADRRLKFIQEEFGIAELMGREAGQLSGGQKQRVSIAGLLAVQPSILLLDEPTSELDPVSKSEIIDLVTKVKAKLGITLVIVEQDVEEAVRLADRFLLLDSGKILLEGKPHEFFRDPEFLLEHGVYSPEVSLVFGSLVNDGLVKRIPLDVSEAREELNSSGR